jgi:poly-gamma-glutamate synthesis protein (capsule biosynthesis protein)
MLVACKEKPAPVAEADAAPAVSSVAMASASAPLPVPAPEVKKKSKLVILAGGDVNLGRGLGKRIIEKPDLDPFAGIQPLLKTADLRFINLESQLSDQKGATIHPENHLVFTGPPGGADVLARAGIGMVSVANNHMWDYGKKGFYETLANLERVKVPYVGARREPNTSYQPTIVEVSGFRIAFFAVTHIWNQGSIADHEGRFYVAWASYAPLEKRLKKAKKENDFVFISYHGGGEYGDAPLPWTREFVNAAMRGGADAVFGHHPHVPHGVAWYGTRPAFFSLGNLVFEMHSDYPWTGTSFLARLTFDADGTLQVEACPFYIFAGLPMLFDGKTKEPRERSFRHHLKLISKNVVNGTDVGEPGDLSCMPLTPPVPKKKR